MARRNTLAPVIRWNDDGDRATVGHECPVVSRHQADYRGDCTPTKYPATIYYAMGQWVVKTSPFGHPGGNRYHRFVAASQAIDYVLKWYRNTYRRTYPVGAFLRRREPDHLGIQSEYQIVNDELFCGMITLVPFGGSREIDFPVTVLERDYEVIDPDKDRANRVF